MLLYIFVKCYSEQYKRCKSLIFHTVLLQPYMSLDLETNANDIEVFVCRQKKTTTTRTDVRKNLYTVVYAGHTIFCFIKIRRC